jgi:lipopolysaccharide/colanic/teichoic acid biosynthesis glycosyltransferase
MLKRSFDIFFSLLGIIILSPLFLLIAVCICIDSKGPIFFRQVRVGRNEEEFKIHKFRTMVDKAESKGAQLTTHNDSRITRIGNLLRKYKLDELPQLIDVFSGKMSLVGPRPEVPKYVNYYTEEEKKIIYSVRPGITDYASLEFKEENSLLSNSMNFDAVYINTILPIKIKYYKEYVLKNSIYEDIKIIFFTIVSILKIR